MDKRALQTYSIWAKNELEKQIEISLKLLGINARNDIKNSSILGDYTIIDGDNKTYDRNLYTKRERIVGLIKREGYQEVIEEFAYTWFNRIIALRFVEVHNYLPHGYRVLSSRNNSKEPEILEHLNHLKEELQINLDLCAKLKSQGLLEELYRYVLFCQCNSLSSILPMLFSKDEDYLELLLPRQLLIGDTIITKLLEIDESNFLEDVEIIGWLYQFYISSKKDEVFASKKIITKDTLAAVTQLFTPDWIVRYMTENSIGRLWLESYPSSMLKQEMKYYVDDAEQSEEVYQQLEKIKYKNVNPLDIKVIEPCCGSGHILVYAFDLLCKIYEEQGYSKKDIPTLILKNNLVGLDVDKRASQLASFALIMKARSYNNRFFNEQYFVNPKVFEIKDSSVLISLNYKEQLKDLNILNNDEVKEIDYLVETFKYGKVIGSLLKIDINNFKNINNSINKIQARSILTIFNSAFLNEGLSNLLYLNEVAEVLASKYDVMITNPPYIGISAMEKPIKDYAYKFYPDSKIDMFAMFMETDLVKKNGFTAMINMHSWMFLSSYEQLRLNLMRHNFVVNTIHLGTRAFEMISGDVVQTVSFVMRNSKSDYAGKYFRLVDSENKKESFLGKSTNYIYICNLNRFNIINGCPFIYWMSETYFSSFKKGILIDDISNVKQGIIPGNVEAFVRFWFEVSNIKIGYNHLEYNDIVKYRKKWFLYNKGGTNRKWFGNNEYVINMENNGFDIIHSGLNNNHRLREPSLYFKKAITWSKIGSNSFSTRLMPKGMLFDIAGCCIFDLKENEKYVLGFTNSIVCQTLLRMLSPTINFEVEHIKKLPIIYHILNDIDIIVEENILISKKDWDFFETSWDFVKHPLLEFKQKDISDSYLNWERNCLESFYIVKNNEKKLNNIFIDIYNLRNELNPNSDDNDITIRKADKTRDIKSFISYLIGIIMGRYSLDKEGLVYAGGTFNMEEYITYKPVSDGIVPVYSKLGMNDGVTSKIIELIKIIYGEETYHDNIDFIAEALGKKNNESSEETLNRYLCDDFYADHLKIYQKRPIYWMFSSGKNNAFKCLIYLHRYNEDTLAIINSKYFLPESTRIKIELEDINKSINSSEGKDKIKLEKERSILVSKYNEALEYGQILDHKANEYIVLDLDDGVKVNYQKFQDIEIVSDSHIKTKKNLLVTIK